MSRTDIRSMPWFVFAPLTLVMGLVCAGLGAYCSDRRRQGRLSLTPTQEVPRARIISAAIDCLVQEGWARTTLARIAERAGISRGLISCHLDNRDDLTAAVLESVVGSVFGEGAARIGAAVRAEISAAEMVRVYVTENLRFIAEHLREMAALDQIMPNLRREDGSET